jgi:hypothetical protein
VLRFLPGGVIDASELLGLCKRNVPGLVVVVAIVVGLVVAAVFALVLALGERLFKVNSEGLNIILAALDKMSFVSMSALPGEIVSILIMP